MSKLDYDACLKEICESGIALEEIGGAPVETFAYPFGSYGPAALKVQDFVAAVKNAITIPVKTWDERLTSVQANRLLIAAKVRRKERKEKVDKSAAAILLQSYLDSLQHE